MNGIQEHFLVEIIGEILQALSKVIWFFLSNHSSVYSMSVLTKLSLNKLNSRLGPKANSVLEIKQAQGLSLSTGLLLVLAF